MNLPNEFFTMNSFTTLSGSSGIVFIATSVIKYLTNGKYNPKWLAFVMSELVACLGVYLFTNKELVSFILGLLNGMLIFATALGINTVVAPAEKLRVDLHGVTKEPEKTIQPATFPEIKKIFKLKSFLVRKSFLTRW